MANTYTLIASNTLGSNQSSVTFSSIPNTYTDLVLRYSGRTNAGSSNDFLQLRINGLSTTIYSDTVLYGTGAGGNGVSTQSTSAAQLYAPRFGLDGANATTNTFSNSEIYIPNYTASQNKPISAFGVTENNTGSDAYVSIGAGLIRETGAISSIELTAITGPNFVTNSSFFLYGIKNS